MLTHAASRAFTKWRAILRHSRRFGLVTRITTLSVTLSPWLSVFSYQFSVSDRFLSTSAAERFLLIVSFDVATGHLPGWIPLITCVYRIAPQCRFSGPNSRG